MRERVCDEILNQQKEDVISDKLLEHLNSYHLKGLFREHYFKFAYDFKDSFRNIEECTYYCKLPLGSFIRRFRIDYIRKEIIIYHKDYYECMKVWGEKNKFSELVKCWE
jgi:hypothetical protein